MARGSSRGSDKLSAEERRLQKQQQELQRQEELLKRKLQVLPVQIEARKSRERELAKLRAHMASPAISLGGVRGPRAGKSSAKRRPLPARELQNARIKFLILCLILVTFVILLWRSIPS